MNDRSPEPRPPLKPWVLPVIVASVLVIIVGILATYADTSQGAVVVLIGLIGFAIGASGAARGG